MYGVVLFENTQSAMKAETIAEEAGIAVKLIPTPREFSKNCGIAMRFDWSDIEKVRQALSDSETRIDSIHEMSGAG